MPETRPWTRASLWRWIMPGTRNCPTCGWSDIRFSTPQGFLDRALRLVFLAPFRCRKCRRRFYRPALRLDESPLPMPAEIETRQVAVPLAISVLILDDDLPLRQLFRRVLQKEGYFVHEASGSQEIPGSLPPENVDLV